MPRARLAVVASIILAALVSGCGSSSKSASSAASSQSASTPSQTAGVPATAPSTAAAALLTGKPNKLGTILGAGPKRLTVYLFEADKGSSSSCTGACAAVWPPVTTAGPPKAQRGALAADLATITRPDGSTQVTYKGHPLYYYARDAGGDAGDAYGQGLKSFGAGWYVLAPSGNKIDKS